MKRKRQALFIAVYVFVALIGLSATYFDVGEVQTSYVLDHDGDSNLLAVEADGETPLAGHAARQK